MIVLINSVLSAIYSLNTLWFLFTVIGVYAVCWWLIDNLKSIVCVVRTLLTPYFQPQEDLSLIERYGNWAGWLVFL